MIITNIKITNYNNIPPNSGLQRVPKCKDKRRHQMVDLLIEYKKNCLLKIHIFKKIGTSCDTLTTITPICRTFLFPFLY